MMTGRQRRGARWSSTGFVVLAALASTGCISVKSYLDPAGHRASFNDLQRVNPPYQLV